MSQTTSPVVLDATLQSTNEKLDAIKTAIENNPSDLDSLENVNITAPQNGQVLKYDSVNNVWANGEGGGGGSSNTFNEEQFTVEGDNVSLSTTVSDKLDSIDYAYENGFVSRNLLDTKLTSKTYYGVTITKNEDSTYTLNGTFSDSSFASTEINDNLFLKKGRYKVVGCENAKISINVYTQNWIALASTNGVKVFTLDSDTNVMVRLMFQVGATANNLVIKPMITNDFNATYDDFTPYAKSNVELTEELSSSPTFPKFTKANISNGTLLYGGYSQKGNLVVVNARIKSTINNSNVELYVPKPLEEANYIGGAVYCTTDNNLGHFYLNANTGTIRFNGMLDKEYLVSATYISR